MQPDQSGGLGCSTFTLTKSRVCDPVHCDAGDEDENWVDAGSCSVTCGVGKIEQSRPEITPALYGGSACVLYDDDNNSEVTVVQPNEDGTYWRKVVRNKMHRTREMRNVAAAKEWIKEALPDQDHDVMSSYGPYTSTAGQVMGISTKALPFKEDQIKEKIVSKSR